MLFFQVELVIMIQQSRACRKVMVTVIGCERRESVNEIEATLPYKKERLGFDGGMGRFQRLPASSKTIRIRTARRKDDRMLFAYCVTSFCFV